MHYSDWPEEKKLRARAAHRRWKDKNKEKRATYWKEYEAARPVSEKLFRSMKNRKIAYEISPEDIVVPDTCPICESKMQVSTTRGGNSRSPTLDKVVPDKGYVKGNVAVICKYCNSLKGAGSAEDHRRIAAYIDTFTALLF